MEIKFFKAKKSFKKGGLHVDPNICWNILLCMALVIVLASFVFGFFLFTKINKEPTLSETDRATRVKKISKERVDRVLEYFSERAKKSSDIINSPSPISDPSL